MARIRQFSNLAPLAILIAGLAATSISTWQLDRVLRARELERFARAVQDSKTDILNRLDLYTEMLRGGAGLIAAGGVPDAGAFQRYYERLEIDRRHPGVQGIGFSLRVPADRLEEAIERVRRDEPGFSIYPPHERDEYHAVIHLEPRDVRNQHAIGFDMFTDPVRRAAMERARDTGAAAATGRVTLVQEIDDDRQPGFLVYVPVYESGDVPATVEERRRRLIGFVYSPFRAGDFLDQLGLHHSFRLVDFEVYDGGRVAPEARLSTGPMAGSADAEPPRFTQAVPLEVAGHPWTVVFTARPEFVAGSEHALAIMSAIGGAVLTLALFAIALMQSRGREEAERSAAELERSASHLRRSEAHTRAILDSALDGVISIDHRGIVTEWNPAAAAVFGYTRDDALGRSLAELIIPPYLREHHEKGLSRYASTGKGAVIGRRFETMAIRADGSELPVELSIVRVGQEDPPTFTGFVRDITERRRAEKQRELMTRELDHRVKNNLSTVVALVDQTASRSNSFMEFVSSFAGRVRAMARLHEMLADNRWTGADLGDVIRGIMAPYLADDPKRVSILGEPVDLPDRIVSPICLALHELATNASKYGALSTPEGRVDIRWEIGPDPSGRRLTIHWREEGGPHVTPPSRRGFGTELVERGLAYEVRAKARLEYAPEGVLCTITLVVPEDVHVHRRTRPARASRN